MGKEGKFFPLVPVTALKYWFMVTFSSIQIGVKERSGQKKGKWGRVDLVDLHSLLGSLVYVYFCECQLLAIRRHVPSSVLASTKMICGMVLRHRCSVVWSACYHHWTYKKKGENLSIFLPGRENIGIAFLNEEWKNNNIFINYTNVQTFEGEQTWKVVMGWEVYWFPKWKN